MSKTHDPFICECDDDGDRRPYLVTNHDGGSEIAFYCEDCAALARSDWNGETASCVPVIADIAVEWVLPESAWPDYRRAAAHAWAIYEEANAEALLAYQAATAMLLVERVSR